MVYQNKVVAAIKVGGKVLRENKDEVTLPFGSEYSILIKNLHSVRIKFRVEADGNKITDDGWIIVPAHGEVELERSIKNGNLSAGNKLKFIERTAAVEEHRGIGAQDGLIRIEYFVEKVFEWPSSYGCGSLGVSFQNSNHFNDGHFLRSAMASNGGLRSTGMRSTVGAASVSGGHVTAMCMAAPANMQMAQQLTEQNDAGITVDGGLSTQEFTQGSWFWTESNSEVIVLKLRGATAGQPAITVEHRPKCDSCGKLNRAMAKFCDRCGTGLISFSR